MLTNQHPSGYRMPLPSPTPLISWLTHSISLENYLQISNPARASIHLRGPLDLLVLPWEMSFHFMRYQHTLRASAHTPVPLGGPFCLLPMAPGPGSHLPLFWKPFYLPHNGYLWVYLGVFPPLAPSCPFSAAHTWQDFVISARPHTVP